MGSLIKAITSDGAARAYIINSKDIVQKAYEIHNTTPVVSAALGRTLTAASMMGAMLKEDNGSLTLQISGSGPVGGIIVVSDSNGNVRGYANKPDVILPLNTIGKLDVAGAVGKDGFISVIKDMCLKEPYIGRSPIVSGEIAEDITNYFATSEQTPTVCALGVLVDIDWSIKEAGGFIISLMPSADEQTISQIEKNIEHITSVTTLLNEGKSITDILQLIFMGLDYKLLSEQNVQYKCTCSTDRITKVLISLGKTELEKLAQEDKNTEIICHFCNKAYNFSKNDIVEIIHYACEE